MEVEFYYGTNIFTLPNGDSYLGEYCAHVSGKIWREGEGVYQTADGQFYEGEWKNDKLMEGRDVKITYLDQSVYDGPLLKNKYDGAGTYTFGNGIKFFCNFSANKPVGDVLMADIDGRLWHGEVIQDRVDLSPENIFFKNIHEHRGKSKLILKDIEPEWKPTPTPSFCSEEMTTINTVTDKNWEKIVFAKSQKTDTRIDLTDSHWYRKFAAYKCRRAMILEKVKNHSGLTKAEANWYMNYATYKRRIKNKKLAGSIVDPGQVDTSLLDRFFSKEYAESCKPYNVIYPSYNWKIPPESEGSFIPSEIEEAAYFEEEATVSVEEEDEFEPESAVEEELVEKYEPPSVGLGTASLYSYMDAIAGKRKLRSCKWEESNSDDMETKFKPCNDLYLRETKSCRFRRRKYEVCKEESEIKTTSYKDEGSNVNMRVTNIIGSGKEKGSSLNLSETKIDSLKKIT